MESMSETAPTNARTRKQACPEEVAYLELVRTTDALSRRLAQVIKVEDLSATQYNVLRILRGAPEGLTCGEIGNRMVTRDPDITRLLDRLEKRNLIERSREQKDRRVVLTKITTDGLDALARLDKPVQDAHRAQLGHIARERLALLSELLIACRQAKE
jgi:MarR family transcriptional regulator, organic hydroperoxide resistance regulator